jgi:hypothetical protein
VGARRPTAMPGSLSRIFRVVTKSALRRQIFAGLPVVLATLSLIGLRGVAGLYFSPPIAFALGVAAAGTALRRSPRGRRPTTVTRDIGLGLAVASCGAALVAVLATGHA